LIQKVLDCVKSYVKNDEAIVATITYVYLSRWTHEPLNLFLKGESTIGKSYITKNTKTITCGCGTFKATFVNTKEFLALQDSRRNYEGN